MDSNKPALIKQLKYNHRAKDVLASFYKLYRNDLLVWICSQIYNESLKGDAEIILHDFFFSLQRENLKNPFSNVRIFEDEKYLVNSFNKYLKNTLIKRSVIRYISKRNRIDFFENSFETKHSFGESLNNSRSEKSKDSLKNKDYVESMFSKEVFESKKRENDLNETISLFKAKYCDKENRKREFEIFMKNMFDGIGIGELSEEYGVSKNAISISIFRVKEKLRAFFKKR